MNCLRGGIKYNSCSGEQGINECIKRRKRREKNPSVVLKGNLRKKTNSKKPVITF